MSLKSNENDQFLLFPPQACSLNLFSAETGRRLLDTTLIFNVDPNGGKPEKVCLCFFPHHCVASHTAMDFTQS